MSILQVTSYTDLQRLKLMRFQRAQGATTSVPTRHRLQVSPRPWRCGVDFAQSAKHKHGEKRGRKWGSALPTNRDAGLGPTIGRLPMPRECFRSWVYSAEGITDRFMAS